MMREMNLAQAAKLRMLEKAAWFDVAGLKGKRGDEAGSEE
jgi:hypothetical protein